MAVILTLAGAEICVSCAAFCVAICLCIGNTQAMDTAYWAYVQLQPSNPEHGGVCAPFHLNLWRSTPDGDLRQDVSQLGIYILHSTCMKERALNP
jgi:hypothetical protein